MQFGGALAPVGGPRLRAGLPHGGKRAEGPENEEREVAEGADDPEGLREALRDHAARYRLATYGGKRSEWVFHHETTRRHARAGERIGRLYRAFAGAGKRAELPEDLNQHDLRHRRVTTWLAEGKSPVLVQKAMGHSDLKTTMGYTHLVSDDLLALVVEPAEQELRRLADG